MVILARQVMAPPSAPELLRRELAEARKQIDDLTNRMERLEERSSRVRMLQNKILQAEVSVEETAAIPVVHKSTGVGKGLTSPPPPPEVRFKPITSPMPPPPSRHTDLVVEAIAHYITQHALIQPKKGISINIRRRRNLPDISVAT
eukprot:TRINITY_DN1641_c1_g2_i1.p1 TRINITY_DN1641_c1_g2~~TRINITY_DN1641_c1_g2_i1.p1  ORF type:complete len:146 (+),score=29.16 TRINITY_DN1641_c1_g2_i1:51-488(+)